MSHIMSRKKFHIYLLYYTDTTLRVVVKNTCRCCPKFTKISVIDVVKEELFEIEGCIELRKIYR